MRFLRNILSCFGRKQGDYPIYEGESYTYPVAPQVPPQDVSLHVEQPLPPQDETSPRQVEPPQDETSLPTQDEPPLPTQDETSPTPVEPPPYTNSIGTEQHQFEPPPPYQVNTSHSQIEPPPPQNETTLPQIQPPPYEIEPYPSQLHPPQTHHHSSNTDEIASHHAEPTIYSEENMRQFREDQARLDRVRQESRYREEVRRRANLRRAEILISAMRLEKERSDAFFANKSNRNDWSYVYYRNY